MTDERKELIERWAREAGAIGGIEKIMDRSALSRFAALVRADALEEAAKVCEERAQSHEEEAPHEETEDYRQRMLVYAKHERRCATAIRKLMQSPPLGK